MKDKLKDEKIYLLDENNKKYMLIKTEKFDLQEEYNELLKEQIRSENDIKILLKENQNKEKVILRQQEIINEVKKFIKIKEELNKSFGYITLSKKSIEELMNILKGK